MALIDTAYLLFSGTLTAAGLTMVGAATRAYAATSRSEMLHLSVGFSMIVAAVLATTISGFLNGFRNPQLMFTVQYAVMTIGFLFVVYSIVGD